MKIKSFRAIIILLKYVGWILAIVIFVIFLRVFIVEFYYVPSSSMAATLYDGDEIMVSKIRYGGLLPNSINEIPLISGLMYIKPLRDWLGDIHLNNNRAPGWKKPKRGEVMVFKVHKSQDLLIKRCVAGPGDTLKIVNDTIFINKIAQSFPETTKLNYRWKSHNEDYSDSTLQKIIGRRDNLIKKDTAGVDLTIPITLAQKISLLKCTKTCTQITDTSTNRYDEYFPYISDLNWNSSIYGPIVVPHKGAVVYLDFLNLPFYRKIIEDYENNLFEISSDGIYINGCKTQHYTFRQNYYFMLGDNRHYSYDSRFSGFVPEDFIIGKATFVLFSLEKDSWRNKGMRWRRTLKRIK